MHAEQPQFHSHTAAHAPQSSLYSSARGLAQPLQSLGSAQHCAEQQPAQQKPARPAGPAEEVQSIAPSAKHQAAVQLQKVCNHMLMHSSQLSQHRLQAVLSLTGAQFAHAQQLNEQQQVTSHTASHGKAPFAPLGDKQGQLEDPCHSVDHKGQEVDHSCKEEEEQQKEQTSPQQTPLPLPDEEDETFGWLCSSCSVPLMQWS